MRLLLLAQLLVPLGLIAWLALTTPRSWLGVGMQIAAVLLTLAALAQVGLWLFPPWWTPLVAALAAVAASGWSAGQRPPRQALPSGPGGWTGVALFAILAAGAVIVLTRAFRASRLPPGPVAELSAPLPRGTYLVVNGGAWELMNSHRESARSADPRFIPWRGNGWAVDLVRINGLGLRAPGLLPPDPEAYEIFGTSVLAPCTGEVVLAVNGLPDMPVPQYDRDHLAGNHVLISCEEVHVLLAHLRQGSVAVSTGDSVFVGDPLGKAGNSGGTGEPHLHIHAQRAGPPGMPIGGDPVPMLIDGEFLVRGDLLLVR